MVPLLLELVLVSCEWRSGSWEGVGVRVGTIRWLQVAGEGVREGGDEIERESER